MIATTWPKCVMGLICLRSPCATACWPTFALACLTSLSLKSFLRCLSLYFPHCKDLGFEALPCPLWRKFGPDRWIHGGFGRHSRAGHFHPGRKVRRHGRDLQAALQALLSTMSQRACAHTEIIWNEERVWEFWSFLKPGLVELLIGYPNDPGFGSPGTAQPVGAWMSGEIQAVVDSSHCRLDNQYLVMMKVTSGCDDPVFDWVVK